jgi:hypothetical protein
MNEKETTITKKKPESTPWLIIRDMYTPHHIAFFTMWIITTVSLGAMLLNGVRSNFQFYQERNILHVGYILALFWYLIQTDSSIKQLSDVNPLLPSKLKIGKIIPVFVLIILFVSEFYDQGVIRPLLMLSTIWILIVWRREINLIPILTGLVVTIIAYFAGLPMWQNQSVGPFTFIGMLVFATPMFLASGLLYKRTGIGGSQLLNKQYSKAVLSFLSGCLIFLPIGLLNAAAGSSYWITWVNRWLLPFSLPLFSGIVEEVWYRLFMVSLVYYSVRPVFNKVPVIAIVFSVLFSGVVFGLGHSGGLVDNFYLGLLFGVPLAVLFVRRDWEYAVGAHYMINFIPWVMVFLEAS